MAKTTRFSRAGTTVNVTVPRASYRRATTHRPATRTTTTRTLSTVYKPTAPAIFKESNTPYIVGGVIAAGLLAYLLWPKSASAAEGSVVMPGQGGQGGQGGVANFPQIPGSSVGFAGPGTYRTTAPSGLRIRSAPSAQSAEQALLPLGTTVSVVGDAGNGWFQVSSPLAGFMCASCPDAPGGPWLVRQA